MAAASNVDNIALSSESGTFIDIFEEGLRYFMGEGELNKTIAQLGSDLDQHGIEYMVVGAVALTAHGYPRFTTDVDIVLTREGLEAFHRELVELGYRPAFEGAKKRLRSTRNAVAIDVMRHRLIVTYQAEAEEVTPEVIITQVLDKVALP